MYIYSMFLLNIVWLFCNYPFLSYVAVSNLTAIYILLLHLGSIRQHLQVHSLWGLKCLTSFFPWRFWVLNNAWKWGPPLLFFFWVFVLLSSQFSVCVLVFQSTWPSRTFIILTPFLYCLGPRVAEPKKWLVPNFIFKGWEWCIWNITTIIHHQIWSADSTAEITVIQSSKLSTLRSTFGRVPLNFFNCSG